MLRVVTVSSLFALVAVAAGCGGQDRCEAIYEKEVKCGKGGEKMPKDIFMAACQAAAKSAETKEEVAAAGECAAKSSCEEFDACGKAQDGKRRAKKIAKSLADGKLKDAFEDCTLDPDDYADATFKAECAKVFADAPTKLTGQDLADALRSCRYGEKITPLSPEFATACQTIATTQLKAATEAAVKSRDAGQGEYKLCLELEDVAKAAGGDAVKNAEVLCKELNVAEAAKKGADEARANAAAKKTDVPYQCSSTADELAALGTEWSKATLADLLKACYVELGLVIIATDAPEAKYSCPYRITQVQEAATKHNLAATHADLATALAGLPKICLSK